MWEPGIDLWPITIMTIIEQFTKKLKYKSKAKNKCGVVKHIKNNPMWAADRIEVGERAIKALTEWLLCADNPEDWARCRDNAKKVLRIESISQLRSKLS